MKNVKDSYTAQEIAHMLSEFRSLYIETNNLRTSMDGIDEESISLRKAEYEALQRRYERAIPRNIKTAAFGGLYKIFQVFK